jgi:hypothetical protein
MLRPAGKSRPGRARERLPSYREPASRDLQVAREGIESITSRTRTVSPSTHPRPASGGAADFLPASALLNHQKILRPDGEEDARCVQPTSATQSNCVHPHLVRSRLALATFAAGEAPRSLKLRAALPGDRTFHDVRDRFGGSSSQRLILMPVPHGPWS